MTNIKPSQKLAVMAEITKVTFCAHDEAETCLQYDKSAWIIANNRGLYLDHGDNLHRAMGNLYAITGISSDKWSILAEVWD